MLKRLLRGYLSRYRGPIVLILALQMVQTVATLWLPTLNADIINKGVLGGDNSFIIGSGGVMLAVAGIQIACSLGAVLLSARVAMDIGADLRQAVFDAVLTFSTVELGRFGTSSLITRNTNDVQQVQTFTLMSLTLLVVVPFAGVGGIVLALNQDVPSSMVLLVAIPILIACVALMTSRLVPRFRVMQARIDRVTRVLREQITGVRVIRAFVRDRHEQGRFGEANGDLSDSALGVGRIMILMHPTVLFAMNASAIAVLWFGGHRVASGEMGVGSLTAFLTYLVLILMAVMTASIILMTLPRASVCAERILEVLGTRPRGDEHPVMVDVPVTRGAITFNQVTCRFPGAEEPVLSGIDLVVRSGETVAIVGRTGSGKSTLLNLVVRLVDPVDGVVTVDGIDVRRLAPARLRAAIAMVPQRAYLFSGTVASNLRLGNPAATDEQLWHALEIAKASAFVAALPDGLGANVAQGGTNLSGGQRQRLAIARAIVHQPRIFLFDDSFSALDYTTDAALRSSLAENIRGATVIIVAQRISSIRDADRIVVIDDGVIVGVGDHDQLLGSSAIYREIVFSQLTESRAG